MAISEKSVAIQAAREAGKVVLSLYGQDKAIETKDESYNLVTEADFQSENLILSMIRDAFPEHSILSEEKGTSLQESEYIWAIDPLDGTNNYAHGFPFFSVSIALCRGKAPILGVVYDPIRDELFCAEQGAGSFLNENRIGVSAAEALPKSLLATGFHYDRGEIMRRTLRQIEAFFTKPIRGIRRTGSAALDLCYVAAGRLDGFWELKLSPWDYAAGSLIVMEAGGKVTDVKGNDCNLFMNNVLASNTKIHNEMLSVINE